MKASLYIWLARNSSVWFSDTSLETIKDAGIPSSNTAFLSSPKIKGSLINTLNALFFSTRETHTAQTQFYNI